MAAWNACGDSQRATLTNRNSALGDRLRCRRVDRYPSWVLKNARVRSQACRNASSCPSGTSNALIKTTGSPFMIVPFLILLLAMGGLEPGAELAEHACGRVELGGAPVLPRAGSPRPPASGRPPGTWRGHARSGCGDGRGGEQVGAVFEFAEYELGDVGAADGVADGDRQAWLSLEPSGGGAVGEPGGPDDGPVQVAGGDQGFLAFFVGEFGAQPPRHEDALEQEPRMAPGVADAVAGDPDQPAHAGGLHRGDDVGGAGMQVVAGRGGPGLPERADHRVVAGNSGRHRTGVEHVAGHFAQAGLAARPAGGADERGDLVPSLQCGLGDGAPERPAGTEDKQSHDGSPQPIANPAAASMNPASSSQDRRPWKNSHRLRTCFQFSGGCWGSQRPVARLTGTLKITVEVSAAIQAPAAAHRHPGGPPWPPGMLASAIPSARVAVISGGMTRPKVRSNPCSTWMWSTGGRRRITGCTNA